MRCLSCKHDLSHLTGSPHRCSECGRAFDPNEPQTFETPKSVRSGWQRYHSVLAILSFLLNFVFCYLLVSYPAYRAELPPATFVEVLFEAGLFAMFFMPITYALALFMYLMVRVYRRVN